MEKEKKNPNNDLYWINSEFDSTQVWTKPIPENLLVDNFMETSQCVKYFDQNGS